MHLLVLPYTFFNKHENSLQPRLYLDFLEFPSQIMLVICLIQKGKKEMYYFILLMNWFLDHSNFKRYEQTNFFHFFILIFLGDIVLQAVFYVI